MDFNDPKNTKSYSDALKVDPNSIITTSIDTVPVTVERKPYQPGIDKPRLAHAGKHPQLELEMLANLQLAGVARANLAATHERPEGTTDDDWADRHRDQTVSIVYTLQNELLISSRFSSNIAISLTKYLPSSSISIYD
jgi:phage replication-related protein YjqB (UPF0714/DUF867 family)